MGAAGLDAIVQLLAGQLVGQTSLLRAAEEHEEHVRQMTRGQYKVLDHLSHHRYARRTGSLHVPDPRPDRDTLIAATAIEHGSPWSLAMSPTSSGSERRSSPKGGKASQCVA